MSTVARSPSTPPEAPVRRRHRAAETSGARTPSRRFVRRRLILAAALAVLLALAAAAVLALTGSGEAAPATGAVKIVPADALAYVNLSTDPARPAVKRARGLAARFPDWPLLANAAVSRLESIVAGSSASDFATSIRPWLGDEASLALLPAAAGASPQSLVVLDVSRPALARAYLTRTGATAAGGYDGVRLLARASGTELAFVGHYLVAGSGTAIRAAIDAARGRAPSLAHDAAYERAAAGEPAGRVLDAYLPAAGIRGLLAARTGVTGAIGLMLDRPGLRGAAISVAPAAHGVQVLVHSISKASQQASFKPTLQSVLPSGSALMLDVADLARAAPGLLRAAATAGIAASVGPLLARLGAALTAQGVNVHHALSIFGGETAVALAPGATPAVLIVARVHDEAAARTELASLESPVSTLFSPSGSSGLQVPELADHEVAGATVHELQLGPGLQVEFGVFNGIAALSTSVQAIDAVARRSRTLADDPAYKATLPGPPPRVSSLVFGDLSRLLTLAEQTGLTSGTRTRELLPDLAKLHAIGVSSTSRGADTTTDLSLEIP